MSQLTRPTKQGGANTYQGKVGAGYTTILASEMDADLDKIYSAWNTGVDGSNIQPGVITGAMLAPNTVGSRELADLGVATGDIADLAVTTPKIADGAVTAGKLVGGGVMGGDLTGTYPSPSLGPVQSGVLTLVPRASVRSASGNYVDLSGNAQYDPSYNTACATWVLRLDFVGDDLVVLRAPAGTTAFAQVFQISGAGRTICNLADLSVIRGQLAINAIYGGGSAVANPVTFVLGTPNVWTNFLTTASFTTRGAFVQLCAAPSLSVQVPSGQALVKSRWVRDATPVIENSWLLQTAAGSYVPVPGFNWIDNMCPAGSHTYSYQVMIPTGATMTASGVVDGGLLVYEVG